MTRVEQLQSWLAGRPVHNQDGDECCPDFSCCKPRLLAPRDERKIFTEAFLKGDEAVTDTLLLGFLRRAVDELGQGRGFRIHLVSDGETDDGEDPCH